MNKSNYQFKRLTTSAMVTLALASMNANAGPGTVTLPTGRVIGTYYANSPTLRKFVDTLPGLTSTKANKFAVAGKPAEYIPIAVADTTTYPGSNYYVIAMVEHDQWMHSDLQKATTQRSYVQIYAQGQKKQPAGSTPLTYPNGTKIFWKDAAGKDTTEQVFGYDKPHYLGPFIQTTTGTPVRVKMVNLLPVGSATLDAAGKVLARNGDMFLPVDETLIGAGSANDTASKYTQNRGNIHLHGGDSPWISDGTPLQWVAASGDPTAFKKGDSLINVPDMPFPGEGSQTLYWPNDQSGRTMWFHDHTSGITRQNVYAGAASGYLISDAAETALLNGGSVNGQAIAKAIPGAAADQLVFVIQDKTFVPNDIAVQDSKWDTAAWGKPGDLWYPHVYEPAQIWSQNGSIATTDGVTVAVNPAGRWDYAVDPLTGNYLPPLNPLHADADYGDVPFPDGSYGSGAGKGPSATPESYMDTPLVNGVAYPTMTVEPKAYRARFVNAANDRYWNLSLWVADPSTLSADGRKNTEVKVIADPTATVHYPTPGGGVDIVASRAGGIPDPALAGPAIIQFGNETGLLPKPVVHTPKPMTGTVDAVTGEFTLARGDDFYLASAERADTVIDFSQFAGKTLILYNDSSAPVPGGDPRYDYYTGDPDQTPNGGAPTTAAGFGPNTRTVMQINVAAKLTATGKAPTAADAYDAAGTGGALATELPKAYAATVDAHVAPSIEAGALPTVDVVGNTITLPDGSTHPLKVKTIEGFTDPTFGRLIAQLGVELPDAAGNLVTTPLAYADKPSDILSEGETQYWIIKNNDVDTHPMHFHLFNVQVIARIDQATKTVFAPQPDEKGWKENVKNWGGEDVIVAMRPKTPQLPFGLPNSVRLMDPTLPEGAVTSTAITRPGSVPGFAFLQVDPITGLPVLDAAGNTAIVANTRQDYGWEYIWHCHILGHEENDLMRPMVYHPNISVPGQPTNIAVSNTGVVSWTDATPAGAAATKGNPANEMGFSVQRVALNSGTPVGAFAQLASASPVIDSRVNTLANATSFASTLTANTDYQYKVVSVNEAGVNESTVTTVTQAQLAPTLLTAVQGGNVGSNVLVNLAWKDNASNEDGYVVYRNGSAIANLPANSTSFVDQIAPVASPLPYSVVATKIGWPDSVAATSSMVPKANLVAATSLTSLYDSVAKTITLNWVDQSFAETGYVVKRATGTVGATGAVTWSAYAARPTATTVLAANAISVVDTAVAANTLYSYQVTPVAGTVTGPVTSLTMATATALTAPSKVQSGGVSTASTIAVGFQASTAALLTGYEVQQCIGTAVTCAAAGAVWSPSKATFGVQKFTVSGLATKTSYGLRMRAVSNVVSGGLVSPWTATFVAKTL